MRTRNERLREAQRCERDAEAAHSEQLSLVLRRIAAQWRMMADISHDEIMPGCVDLMDIGTGAHQ
jgi:hypothetical protein